MPFFIFPLIIFIVFMSLIFFAWRRLISIGDFSERWSRILWVCFVLSVACHLFSFSFPRIFPDISFSALQFLFLTSWLFVAWSWACLLFVGFWEVSWGGYRLFHLLLSSIIRILPRRKAQTKDNFVINPERRSLITKTASRALFGGALLVTGSGVTVAHGGIGIERVSIPIQNLPAAFHGYRILQITDLHVSSTISQSYVEEVVELSLAQNPDLVACTGDFIDGFPKQLKAGLEPLRALTKVRDGAFFCTGNHEYIWDAPAWIPVFRELGMVVLENEHRVITRNGARLVIAGVHDYGAARFVPEHRSDPKQALIGARDSDVRILLAHQPRSIFEASRAGYDLQISGHTHGGQVSFFRPLVLLQQPYVEGLHLYRKTWIYVSRGTGYWGPPIRLGASPVVVELRLLPA